MSTSFYEDASLVMIPSGYKTSKVYSAKPTTGSGDLDFTRSNDTATRVGPDGLIEKVRTNLVTYSEQLENGAWTKVDTTIVANAVANPLNGAVTADKMTDASTATTARYTLQSPASSGTIYTSSGYFKKAEYNFVTLHAFGINGAVFNLDTGVKVSQSGGVGTITSVGDGWYRCTFSFTAGGSSVFFSQSPAGNISYAGTTGSGIFAFGLQVETGDIATDYIATTSAAVSVGPVANVPRLDYLNSSCPRLLLEPQRTNTLLLSEQLDVVATWSRGNVSVTANNAVSPDGYTNADLITADGTTTQHYVLQGQSGAARTYSIFLKMGTQRYVQILTSGTAAPVANYDLQNGVANMVGSSSTASIENYGNGWYRCILSTTDAAAASFYLLFASSMTSGRFEANNSSGTIWAYGAQAEAGAYATSYIPTLGAAVTRGADAASKTGISSLIGQTQGTIYLDVENNESEVNSFITLSPSATTLNNHIYLGQSAGNLALYVRSGGTYSIIAASITSISGIKKVALAYGPSFARIYVNGTQVYNSTAAVIPSGMDKIEINTFNTSSDIGRVSVGEALIFKTILSNDALQALTTL